MEKFTHVAPRPSKRGERGGGWGGGYPQLVGVGYAMSLRWLSVVTISFYINSRPIAWPQEIMA